MLSPEKRGKGGILFSGQPDSLAAPIIVLFRLFIFLSSFFSPENKTTNQSDFGGRKSFVVVHYSTLRRTNDRSHTENGTTAQRNFLCRVTTINGI